MIGQETVRDALVAAIQRACGYNRLDQVAPATVLWPDAAREWEPLIPDLRAYLPIYSLGAYNPTEGRGPVSWLRCVVARVLPDAPEHDAIPVLYLPGVATEQVRDAVHCPRELQPLTDLRYRGVLWSTPDGRDWTVAAFLQNKQDGLGVEVRQDTRTRQAMLRALRPLALMSVTRLREEAPWRASDFEALGDDRIERLITQGESATLEFKSTARWNVRGNIQDKKMELEILKTVASFLNSKSGGTLLIGVEDNGNVYGLEADYTTFKAAKGQERDKFENWLMSTLLLHYLGKVVAPYISATFHDLDGRDVCEVAVAPAPEPVFYMYKETGPEEEFFYVRTGNAKNRLLISDAVKYIRQRWG